MRQFPKEKHICSWLGLAPKYESSGGMVLKNKILKTKNRAGQAFRMAAQSVKQADCVFGMTYRMLKHKVEYVTNSVEEYEKRGKGLI